MIAFLFSRELVKESIFLLAGKFPKRFLRLLILGQLTKHSHEISRVMLLEVVHKMYVNYLKYDN